MHRDQDSQPLVQRVMQQVWEGMGKCEGAEEVVGRQGGDAERFGQLAGTAADGCDARCVKV